MTKNPVQSEIRAIMPRLPRILLTALCVGMLAACGGGGGGGATGDSRDLSDGSSSGGTSALTLSLSASPMNVSSGGSSTLTWSTANTTACTASGAWNGSKSVSGTQSTGALSSTSSYSFTCVGAGGSVTQTVSVTVGAPPPVPAPTVSLSVSPANVASGNSSMLSWSSTNATSCTASGAWSGSKPSSSSQSTGALTSDKTYVLACTGSGGTAQVSESVTVTTPPPTLTFSANPMSVASGGSSMLTWSTANTTACTASGGWLGAKAISGSEPTEALTSGKTYTLKCDGTGSSITKSVTVSVYTNSAALSWDASSEPDVTGYRVYYGTSPGNYVQAQGSGIVVNGTSYMVSGLTSQVRYYFSVTAYDSSGNESDYAREVSKDIP